MKYHYILIALVLSVLSTVASAQNVECEGRSNNKDPFLRHQEALFDAVSHFFHMKWQAESESTLSEGNSVFQTGGKNKLSFYCETVSDVCYDGVELLMLSFDESRNDITAEYFEASVSMEEENGSSSFSFYASLSMTYSAVDSNLKTIHFFKVEYENDKYSFEYSVSASESED